MHDETLLKLAEEIGKVATHNKIKISIAESRILSQFFIRPLSKLAYGSEMQGCVMKPAKKPTDYSVNPNITYHLKLQW